MRDLYISDRGDLIEVSQEAISCSKNLLRISEFLEK